MFIKFIKMNNLYLKVCFKCPIQNLLKNLSKIMF